MSPILFYKCTVNASRIFPKADVSDIIKKKEFP